jgi:hypothetical protein
MCFYSSGLHNIGAQLSPPLGIESPNAILVQSDFSSMVAMAAPHVKTWC